MIKLKKIRQIRYDENKTKYIDCFLYADTKQEVTNGITGEDVDSMEDNAKIDVGSMVLTSDFEVAQLNSSNQWVWG